MSRYRDSDRLLSVRVAERGLSPDVLGAVTKATIQYSTTQTTQFVFSVVDPELALLAGGFMPKRTPVTYARLRLEVAVREVVVVGTSTPALQLTCRAAGVQRLKRAVGPYIWRGLSWTAWAKEQARIVGLGFLGQPSAVKAQIVRAGKSKGSPAASSWDVLQDGANELGFLAYEAAGVIYFGQPTWLAAHVPQLTLRWHGSGSTKTDPGLLSVPLIRDSDDDTTAGYTGTLATTPDLSEVLAPPASIRLEGLGPYSARYMATDVTLDLDGVTAGSVSIATPVNPEPQPDTSNDTAAAAKAANPSTKAKQPAYVATPVWKPDQVPTSPRPYRAPGSSVGAI